MPFSAKSDFASSFHRLPHRQVVGILEIAADGNAGGNPRHAYAKRLEETREVDRRGLALDRRVGGKNDLLDAAVIDARQQTLDLQIIRPDAMKR